MNKDESMELTQNDVAEIAARHGTINDFGKTFFNDSELFDFVVEVMSKNRQKASNIRKAAMKYSEEHNGVEW